MKEITILALPLFIGCMSSASAVTTLATPATLTQLGLPPGPTIAGGVLTLNTVTTDGGQSNQVGFNLSDPGIKPSATFVFTFNISNQAAPTATADGFSFGFGRTSNVGTTGSGNFGEEMNAAGVLGFGFDTWNNTGPDPGPDGSDFSGISVHWNGALLTQMNNTRLPAPAGIGLAIDNGVDHVVNGTANFLAGTVTLRVDGQPVFTNLPIPGLAPMESRILIGGRTGGEKELTTITNLNVTFVPEPTSALLSLLGVAGILRRRR